MPTGTNCRYGCYLEISLEIILEIPRTVET